MAIFLFCEMMVLLSILFHYSNDLTEKGLYSELEKRSDRIYFTLFPLTGFRVFKTIIFYFYNNKIELILTNNVLRW